MLLFTLLSVIATITVGFLAAKTSAGMARRIRADVFEQVENVIKTSFVQKSYIKNGFPLVHGWVYDMKTGKLIDLDIDFDEILKEVQKVYKLE